MCTRTISHTRGMEYRPNSRTGPYMTGTVTDSGIGHTQRSADIAPDPDGESDLQRLVRRRAQQLKEDSESLHDRLERYIQRRSIEEWTPPTRPSYNRFDARLKSFDTSKHRVGVPSPNSLAEAGFFFQGTSLYKTQFFHLVLLSKHFTYFKHFAITGNLDNTTCFHCGIGLRHWVPGDIPLAEHAIWSTFCVYVTYIKGTTCVD